ncbi:hypothetical protein [Agromyces sp. SYSU T00194]|uniref:hypothetical protein n=1 Tax=Agromyces chitinivorans TaxID=3158560 RepID=UPI00339A53DC
MSHMNPYRRRVRAVRHLAGAATHGAVWRHGIVVGAHGWVGAPNFGDELMPWLLPRYGVVPVHRLMAESRLVGIGSNLQVLPETYGGAIWGSGLIEDTPHPLPDAKVLAVRGRLTARLIGAADDVPLGDPGLLVARRMRLPSVLGSVASFPVGLPSVVGGRDREGASTTDSAVAG